MSTLDTSKEPVPLVDATISVLGCQISIRLENGVISPPEDSPCSYLDEILPTETPVRKIGRKRSLTPPVDILVRVRPAMRLPEETLINIRQKQQKVRVIEV